MPTIQSEFNKSYNSFSGVDIKAVVGSRVLATLQAISFSITREKAPIFTLGSAAPRSFSRGKRGVAGTMIFVLMDRHPLLDPIGGLGASQVLLDIDELQPGWYGGGNDENLDIKIKAISNSSNASAGSPVHEAESSLTSAASDQKLHPPFYADQIPPFNVTMVGANEYGALMKMFVAGCEILNEGSGVSIDDIVTEHEFTYVAREVSHWQPIASSYVNQVGFSETPTQSATASTLG